MQISDTEYGQPHVNEEQNPQQQPATSAFPWQMIEQINIALESKKFLEHGH